MRFDFSINVTRRVFTVLFATDMPCLDKRCATVSNAPFLYNHCRLLKYTPKRLFVKINPWRATSMSFNFLIIYITLECCCCCSCLGISSRALCSKRANGCFTLITINRRCYCYCCLGLAPRAQLLKVDAWLVNPNR